MLAPASTHQQGNTHNRGTYRYSVQRETTDSSGHKTAGDMWPAPARRLSQTHMRAAVEKTGDKISIPLRWQKINHFQVWEKSVGGRGQLLAP